MLLVLFEHPVTNLGGVIQWPGDLSSAILRGPVADINSVTLGILKTQGAVPGACYTALELLNVRPLTIQNLLSAALERVPQSWAQNALIYQATQK